MSAAEQNSNSSVNTNQPALSNDPNLPSNILWHGMLLIRILFTFHCRCSLSLLSSMKSSCSELKGVYFVSLAYEFVSRGCLIIYKLTLKVEGLFQVTSSTNLTEITCGLIRRKKYSSETASAVIIQFCFSRFLTKWYEMQLPRVVQSVGWQT